MHGFGMLPVHERALRVPSTEQIQHGYEKRTVEVVLKEQGPRKHD